MKTFSRAYCLVLASLSVAACQIEKTGPETLTVRHTLQASILEEDAVKTILDPSDDACVLWKAGERVNVFVGNTSCLFTGDNSSDAAIATFSGEGPADLGTYVMLSPYNAGACRSADVVSTTLVAAQTGLAGGYQNGTALTAGISSTSSVVCRQVCSGIRFKVGRSDVTAIVLQGNGGEKIAGDFSFSFSAGIPVAGAGTENIITLSAPGGGTFEADEYYYLVMLPTLFPSGIRMTAYAGTEVGTLDLSTELSFSRGVFKDFSSTLNERMTWTDTHPVSVYYGPQNSFCIRPGVTHAVAIDVSPRLIADHWQRSGLPALYGSLPDAVSVLWGDAVASLEGTTLTVYSETPGSSLVAIKKDAVILWSFLIWVTDSAPAETTLPGGAVLMPTLGGDCYFQWGRKDPLKMGQSVLDHPGDAYALSTSIRHPDAFIKAGGACYDWYAAEDPRHQDATLWGDAAGSKTVWDPCPAGWRIPASAHFPGLTETDAVTFDRLGMLVPDPFTGKTVPNEDFGWDANCWTRDDSGGDSVSLLMKTDGVGFVGFSLLGNVRYSGLSVRCVKE